MAASCGVVGGEMPEPEAISGEGESSQSEMMGLPLSDISIPAPPGSGVGLLSPLPASQHPSTPAPAKDT